MIVSQEQIVNIVCSFLSVAYNNLSTLRELLSSGTPGIRYGIDLKSVGESGIERRYSYKIKKSCYNSAIQIQCSHIHASTQLPYFQNIILQLLQVFTK